MNINHSPNPNNTRCSDISRSKTPGEPLFASLTTVFTELTDSSTESNTSGKPKAANGSEAVANSHPNQNAALTETAATETSHGSSIKKASSQDSSLSSSIATPDKEKAESGDKTAESGVLSSKKAEFCTQTLPRPIKSLRELGLTKDTLERFKILNVYGIGLTYPVFDINGAQSQLRICIMSAKRFDIHWLNRKLLPSQTPQFYNLEALKALKSVSQRQNGVFIVPQEFDVWTMEQNNLSAICCIGKSDYVRLGAILEEQGIQSVTAIFEHTFEGRCQALAMNGKINVKILFLKGPFGATITELFEWADFSDEKFRDEIGMLPSFSPLLDRLWKEKPESMREGLPEAEQDGLLQCLDEDELAQLPRPQASVEDTLLAQGVTLMTGRHTSGKSFVALDMALSISQGLPWHGKGTQSGAAFYLSGEGTEGLSSRVRAWKQAHGVPAVPNFAVVNDAVYIVDPAVQRRVIDTVRARLQKMNLPPDGAALLVFDTLARYRGALNENDSNDMGQVMDALEEIGRELGAAVLLVHHNNRGDEYRGSSVLPANAVGHLEISNPPSKGQGMQIKIRVSKMKDFAQGHSLILGSQSVEIGGVDKFGKPLTSLVLTLDSGPQTNGEQLSPKESDALQVLIDFGTAGAKSAVWKKAASDKKKVPSTTFDRAKKRLLELGAVMCDNPGAPGALYNTVAGWCDLPADNDAQDAAENDGGNPGTPYNYQLQEGDPEIDEWHPVGDWIVRYQR